MCQCESATITETMTKPCALKQF